MSPPPSGAAAELRWVVTALRLGGLTASIARLEVEIYLPLALPDSAQHLERGWLDTGAPLSVIPFDVHRHWLVWQPLPGVRVTWHGIPCDVGHIDVWLTDLTTAALRGPYTVLARFPHRDPPGRLVPVLLGLEFFLTHQA